MFVAQLGSVQVLGAVREDHVPGSMAGYGDSSRPMFTDGGFLDRRSPARARHPDRRRAPTAQRFSVGGAFMISVFSGLRNARGFARVSVRQLQISSTPLRVLHSKPPQKTACGVSRLLA